MELKVSEIVVLGEEQRQLQPAKVEEIADSVKEIGLMHPITIDSTNRLIAGLHRLEAFKLLGNEKIPVRVTEETNPLKLRLMHLDENLADGQLLPYEESVALKEKKEIYEKLYPETTETARKSRKNLNKELTEPESGSVTTGLRPNFTEDTAKKTGKSKSVIKENLQIANKIKPETYEKIKDTEIAQKKTELLQLARLEEEEQNEVIEKITEGKATKIRQAIQQTKKEHRKPVIIPDGEYDIIYADPPWKYDFAETSNREIENHYPTMELSEIEELELPTAENAVLFLWATAPKLPEAIDVLKAWGFRYVTCAVWDKEVIGMGYWFRGQHEILLVGVKGKYSPPEASKRISSVIKEKRQAHSRKPDRFYKIIEDMFPEGKYLEVFARRRFNDKWEVWGNEEIE